MRKILLGLIFACFASQAMAADNYSATAGSGLTFGAKDVGSVYYPRHLMCDPTAPTQCVVVDSSGLIGIKAAASAFASNSIVDLGQQSDVACGTATGTCSLIALQKFNNSATNSAIPAQTTNAVNIGAVTNAGSTYKTVAAGQTGQILGSTGAIGDYLSHCVIYPTTTTPGVVTVFDDATGAAANVIAFPGGASSVSNLAPISIPVGAVSITGEWRVTTGANLVVTCYGKFT